jgi:hypothetical protein
LINLAAKDEAGLTNYERMAMGRPPVGPDGEAMNLHHMGQCNDCAIAEVTQTFHNTYNRALHINPKKWGSAIDRPVFDKWRSQYWVNRLVDMVGYV